MVDRIDMEYKIEVLSGDARTTSVYSAAVDTLEEGDCVQMTGTGWNVATAENNSGGIVIRGHVDDKSVKAINKPVVLLGEAILRLDATAPGVTANDGVLSDAYIGAGPAIGDEVSMGPDGIQAATAPALATDRELTWGHVIEVGPNSAWIVVDVK